jgi:hypothetical protein
MDCLYCSYIEMVETAVGVCRCGAGLCRQHLVEQFATRLEVMTIGPVGRRTRIGATERHLVCPACATRPARTRWALDAVD